MPSKKPAPRRRPVRRPGRAAQAAAPAGSHCVVKRDPSFGEVYLDRNGDIAAAGPVRFPLADAKALAALHGGRVVNHQQE